MVREPAQHALACKSGSPTTGEDFEGSSVVAKRMPLSVLAKAIGIDRSWLYRKLKLAGVELRLEPVMTRQGVQESVTIAMSVARRQIKLYQEARARQAVTANEST